MTRAVTERDFRAPEFRDADPADYEFRGDGKMVRKDRFEMGMRDVACTLFGARYEYEVPEVIDAVNELAESAASMARKLAADEIWCTLRSGSLLFDQPF